MAVHGTVTATADRCGTAGKALAFGGGWLAASGTANAKKMVVDGLTKLSVALWVKASPSQTATYPNII